MNRIQKIEINNFKGLYGLHKIDLTKKGKNLMLYGENGSGKSSVAKAIRLFFHSSEDEVSITDHKNLFALNIDNNPAFIKITFGDTKTQKNSTKSYSLDNTNKRQTEQSIKKANKIKGFLDYKSLLKTHYLETDKVNLFKLLVEDLLSDINNPRTNNPIKEDWDELKSIIVDKRTSKYKSISNSDGPLNKFNKGFAELLTEIEKNANELIGFFNYNIKIKLHFNNVTVGKAKEFANQTVFLEIDFFDKENLPKHHNFLNEARLTAISIAIYLGAVLSNVQYGYRFLVLDDVFIGLDTANRLPFLKILEKKFYEYQIFMTTYDKSWYEVVKSENYPNWQYAELYIKEEHQNGYEIPILHSETDFIARAEYYLNTEVDYKASAAYIRTEFEKLVKTFCDKKGLKVKFNKNLNKISGEDFWSACKDFKKIDGTRYISEELKKKIEKQRSLVMNPFVHYDLINPQFKTELKTTIDLVKQLKAALDA